MSGFFAMPMTLFAPIRPPSTQNIRTATSTPETNTSLIGYKRKSVEVEVHEDFCSILADATPTWLHAMNLWFPTAKAYHETITLTAVASEGIDLYV